MNRKSLACRLLIAVTVLAFFITCGVASADSLALRPLPQHPGEFLTLDGIAPATPVTLQTRFRFTSKDGIAALQGLWLAGFSTSPDTPPTALALAWCESTAGWFPIWGLQLQSDAGLLPGTLRINEGQGFLEGSSYVNLQQAMPEVGDVIEAQLSYIPQSGQLAIGVTNLTTNKRMYAQVITTQPYNGTLYPAIGIVGDQHGVQVEQFTVSSVSVPVGTAWDLVVKRGDSYGQPMTINLTKAHNPAIRLAPDVTGAPGTFTVAIDDGGSLTPLLSVPASARFEEQILPLPLDKLPFGQLKLRLSYLDELGQTWALGVVPLSLVAGNVEVAFAPLQIGTNALHGVVKLTSEDAVVEGSLFRLTATATKPGQREGVKRVILEQRLERISSDPVNVSFAVPMENEAQILSLVLEADFDVSVGKKMTGNQFQVLWLP